MLPAVLRAPCYDPTLVPHLQRSMWNGPPERLSDAFRVTKQKGERIATAACEVWSHTFGWELRLEIAGRGLQMSTIVRSAGEMLDTSEQWKIAMIEKGWQLTF